MWVKDADNEGIEEVAHILDEVNNEYDEEIHVYEAPLHVLRCILATTEAEDD